MLQISWWYIGRGRVFPRPKGAGRRWVCLSADARRSLARSLSRARALHLRRGRQRQRIASRSQRQSSIRTDGRTDRRTDPRWDSEYVRVMERRAGVTRAGCCCCYGGMRMQWCIIFAWALCNVREGKRCCLVRWTLDLHCAAADAAVAPLHPSLNGGTQRFMMLW